MAGTTTGSPGVCPSEPESQGASRRGSGRWGDAALYQPSARTGPYKRQPSSLLSPSCTEAVRVLLVGPSLACVGENSEKGSREAASIAARSQRSRSRL